MQRYKITAAVAAILCVGATAAIHAETRQELFAPTGVSAVFNDDNEATTGNIAGFGYEIIQGHAVAEGDIVLGRVSSDGTVLGDNQRGLGQSRLLDRWTNGIVPYTFSDEISDTERQLALAAIAHWNQYTSISLVELTAENAGNFSNNIMFESSNSCASFVGMRGGEQQLWISESCGVGSIIHEIGHAVGLFHEHTRNDRDNYIRVALENIVAGKEFNFDVLNSNSTLLGEYDYGSIMHYGKAFFSANGQDTIEVFGDAEIGQRVALSDRDIQSVNTLYETDLSLSVNTSMEQSDTQIVADVQVTNQGQMGANGLSLTIDVGGNATWFSISPNSGWDCNADGTVLNCSRESLDSSATSLFTVVANSNGTSDSELSAALQANTLETSYENNGYRTTVTAPEPLSAQTTDTSDSNDNGGSDSSEPVQIADSGSTQEPQQEPQPEPGAPAAALPGAPAASQTAEQLAPVEQPAAQAATGQGSPQSANEGSGKSESTADAGGSGGAFSPLAAISLLLGVVVIRRRRHQG